MGITLDLVLDKTLNYVLNLIVNINIVINKIPVIQYFNNTITIKFNTRKLLGLGSNFNLAYFNFSKLTLTSYVLILIVLLVQQYQYY